MSPHKLLNMVDSFENENSQELKVDQCNDDPKFKGIVVDNLAYQHALPINMHWSVTAV